jgi:hypothetical protein
MTNPWRRVLAGLTHTGPGYDLPTQTETDLRATLNTLADRWEQIAGPKPDPDEGLFVDEVAPGEAARDEHNYVLRTPAADLREVLRTGRLPHPLMTGAELEQYGTPEEATS